MPKYLNSGTSVVVYRGVRIEPGETVTVNEQFEVLPTGITKVSNAPAFAAAEFSGVYTGDSAGVSDSIAIPAGMQQFTVEVICSGGVVAVAFDDNTDKKKAIPFLQSTKWVFKNRIVSEFKIHFLVDDSSAVVNIY